MQQKVILGLCKYLGYKDYQHFLKENPPQKENNFISIIKEKKTIIGSIIIALLMSYFGYDITKKDCMIWVKDHYERIKCEKESEVKSAKYNKVIFDNLKQVNPDCNYPFFKPDGSENVWYGKSIKGELEYFTYYGLHPITQKTLDPITQYMIDEHICN